METELGKYIVIEGGDGVGKSTIVSKLAKLNREERGIETFTLEEPDSIRDEHGTALVPIAETLRNTIKAKELGRSAMTNVLLFNASRRENLLQGIEPLLARGGDLFAARNFNSTIVYQGYAQGWDVDDIWRMVAEATSEQYMNPDHTYVLDLPEEKRLKRLAGRDTNATLDTFESLPTEFQTKVNEGYKRLADTYGHTLISAEASEAEVTQAIWDDIRSRDAS